MRQPSLAERQEAAAAAKKALLERHRERINDPGFTERQAARKAVVAAREIRIAERRAAEEARKAQEAAEKAAQEAAERAAQEAALEAELAAEGRAFCLSVRASWNVQVGIGSVIQRLDKIENSRGRKGQGQR